MKKLVLGAWIFNAVCALAVDRLWTGKGDGSSWFDPANWSGNSVPTAAERAKIETGADVVINLNWVGHDDDGIVDVLDLYLGNSGTRQVTINGAPGAILRTNKGPDSYWSFITCSPTGTLNLNVPVLCLEGQNWTIYSQKEGTLNFGAVMTNDFEGAVGTTALSGGRVNMGAGTGLYAPQSAFTWAGGHYDAGYTNYLTLTDNAFIETKSFAVGYYLETGSTRILLDGDEAAINTSGNFSLGSSTYSGYALPQLNHEFVLRRGSLSIVGNFTLATQCPTIYRQEAGEVTVAGDLKLANGSASGGALEVLGGSFRVAGQMTCQGMNTQYTMALADCTFALGAASDITVPLHLSGTVALDIAEGVTVKLLKVSADPGTKLFKTGGGTLIVTMVDGSELDLSDEPLTVLDFTLGDGRQGEFTLAGGALMVERNFSLGKAASAGSRGRLTLNGGAMLSVARIADCREDFQFVMEDGSAFAVGADSELTCNLKLSGLVTFDVAEGATLTLKGPIDLAEDVVICKSGMGTLAIDHDLVWRGDVQVSEGTFAFKAPHLYENAEGDESVRRIDIGASGCFKLDNYSAEVTSPRDVYIEDGGYVYVGDRTMFPVRHLWTNGVKTVRGQCLSTMDNTGIFRGSSAASVMPVPFIWTGNGDGVSWMDANNWEDRERPAAVRQISPILYDSKGKTNTPDKVSAQFCYCDFSAATNVIQNNGSGNVVTIGGFIFNPNSGQRQLVFSPATHSAGARNAIRFSRGQYSPCAFAGPGREVIFDDIQLRQEGSSDWGFHGSGTYRIRGEANLFDPTSGGYHWSFFSYNLLPVSKLVFEYLTNTVDNASRDFLFHGLGDNDRYSDVVIGEGAKLFVNDLVWAKAGFSAHRWTHQLAGSYFSPDRVFMTLVSEKRGTATYYLEGGELDVRTALYVGSMYLDSADYSQYRGGEFQMTGGILRTPLVGCENNQNWVHLLGGDAYVGAGGFQLTDSSGRTKGTRTFTANATPALQWGGATLHAEADLAVGLATEINGIGGNAKLDTDGKTVTFSQPVGGAGVLEVAGAGTVEFAASVSGISLKADAATTLSVANGAQVHVRELVVGGVRQTGTYPAGAGEIVIDGAGDWLADAPFSAEATATCADAKVLDSLAYSCLVAEAGRLTVTGAGSLAFNDGGEIFVRAGDTLVLEVPVTVAGALTFTGGGTVVLKGGFDSAGAATVQPRIVGGTCVKVACEVNGGVKGVCFKVVTDGAAARTSKLEIAEGGLLVDDNGYMPTVDSASFGGIVEISAGGTLYLSHGGGTTWGGSKNRRETLRLNGGTLKVRDQVRISSDGGAVHLELSSGTIDVVSAAGMCVPELPTELAGELVIKVAEGVAATFKAKLGGSGTLRKTGAGNLTLYGDLGGVTELAVDEGLAIVTEPSALSVVSPLERITLAPTALLGLDYPSVIDVTELYVGTAQRLMGTYGEGVSPKENQLAPLVGRGWLEVLTGSLPGTVLFLK